MKMDYYTLTPAELDNLLTTAMVVTVEQLVLDNLITDKVSTADWIESRACIAAKKTGFLRNWLAKIWPDMADDAVRICIVRPNSVNGGCNGRES